MRKRLSLIALGVFMSMNLVFLSASPVMAQANAGCGTGTRSNFFALPTWYQYVCADGEIQIEELNDIWLIAAGVLEILTRVAGLVSVVYLMWGGFRYATSQADPGKVATARNTLIYALVGLTISVVATVLVNYIFTTLNVGRGDLGLSGTAANDAAVQTVINVVNAIAGSVSVLMIVLGGARYVFANGDPAKTKQAQNTIIYALVGVVVVVFSAIISSIVLGRL